MGTGALQQVIASAENVAFEREMTVRSRHLCVVCRQRRAVFRYRGVVKADATHTLCFQCYRSLIDSMRAQRLVQGRRYVSSRNAR
jgi:hypothetical protein